MKREPCPHGESCHSCCIRLLNLKVCYHQKVVLRDINLHIHCGGLTAIIGPNGGGKTTLIRAMLGEIPFSGSLNFVTCKGQKTKPTFGYVPQKIDLDARAAVTVADVFHAALGHWPVWLRRTNKGAIPEALKTVSAAHLWDQKIGLLSGGERQRVLLALALTPLPDLLLLDEPVAALDSAGSELFYSLVSRLRHNYHLAIIMVSHDLLAASQVADRMIFLDKTIICEGTPDEVMQNPEVQKFYGAKVMREKPLFPSRHDDCGLIECRCALGKSTEVGQQGSL